MTPSLELTPIQNGWLKLAEIKGNLHEDLQATELAIQITLKKEQPLSQSIKDAKQLAKEAKDKRLVFSRLIDEKLTTPLMEFEKRNDLLIKDAEGKELELRIAAEKENEKANALINEETAFKNHFFNEFTRVVGEYKRRVYAEISEMYKVALNMESPTCQAVAFIKDELRVTIETKYEIAKINKFNRVLLDDEKANEIYKGIIKPNVDEIKGEMLNEIEKVFANFDIDKENAAAATLAIEKASEKKAEEAKLEEQQTIALNSLINSTNVVAETTVKRELKIDFIESEAFVKSAIATFLTDFEILKPLLRNKKWESLTVKQMVEAIAKNDKIYPQFKYTELCK